MKDILGVMPWAVHALPAGAARGPSATIGAPNSPHALAFRPGPPQEAHEFGEIRRVSGLVLPDPPIDAVRLIGRYCPQVPAVAAEGDSRDAAPLRFEREHQVVHVAVRPAAGIDIEHFREECRRSRSELIYLPVKEHRLVEGVDYPVVEE